MLARLARFSYRHRKLMVFGIWLPLLVVLNVVGSSVGTDYRDEFEMPSSESRRVEDVFKSIGSEEDAGYTAQIVFTAAQGVEHPDVVAAMTEMFAAVDELEGVRVISPYTPDGAQQISLADSPANAAGSDIAFAIVNVTQREQPAAEALADDIRDIGDEVRVDGLRIEYGGFLFMRGEFPASEFLGILAAIVVLLLAFGSVIAMGLPIATAIGGLGVGAAIVGLLSWPLAVPAFGPQMAAMVGLGVGIDYALFIVSRYREHLAMGEDPETAVVASVDSAGRAVVFAGLTVIISLLGLLLMGLAFIKGIAVSSASGVLVMMLASITLLPALIGFVGTRIHTTTRAAATAVALFVVGGLVGVFADTLLLGIAAGLGAGVLLVLASLIPAARALRRPIRHRADKPRERQLWYRWSRFIQHRPWVSFFGGVAVLVVLALPLFSIRLGFGDTGNQPEGDTVREAYDLVADGFGPGSNGPLFLVSTDPAMTAEGAAAVDAALAADAGIAAASPGVEVADGVWSWRAFPTSSPQDEATDQLVHRLRGEVLPATGLQVDVGGWTAAGVDLAGYFGDRLPWLIGAVLVLSFILLMAVFRSLLVPIKAVVMNLLSVGAAYGVIVAVFQWGWGLGLIGIDRAGPVESWAPMMLFAIVFGLSMDYEVFLLSRMKEEYDRTGDNATAVADGLAVTARVITAAAIIMVCVFGAFVLGDERSIKLFGLGMAVAVFVDATVVRMVLVPATMELLGDRNWWIPKWLDRILPRLNVEGAHPHDADERQSELVEVG